MAASSAAPKRVESLSMCRVPTRTLRAPGPRLRKCAESRDVRPSFRAMADALHGALP